MFTKMLYNLQAFVVSLTISSAVIGHFGKSFAKDKKNEKLIKMIGLDVVKMYTKNDYTMEQIYQIEVERVNAILEKESAK